MLNFRIPLITSYTTWASGGYPTPAFQTRGTEPFVTIASGFAFMSCAAHLIILMNFSTYKNNLLAGINYFRWYEYALSSSLMIGLISQLFGIYDYNLLVASTACNACMNLFGLLHEKMNMKVDPSNIDWTAFAMGSFAGAIPWLLILAYMFATPNLSQIPTFVWVILFVYAIMFCTFPINMYYQYMQYGNWSD